MKKKSETIAEIEPQRKLPVAAKDNALPSVTPAIGSLEAFIAQANTLPVLDPEEERALATRYREQGDLMAAHKLVTHNLRFVIQVARGYSGYGLPVADLIQEGNVGLMKAVKKFDPKVKVRLISFAVYWIRAEIHEFILRNWRIVKVATTKAQRKLFFNLRSMKKRLAWLNQDEVREVADQLGVKPKEVLEMESRLSGHDVSFDPYSPDDHADDENTPLAPIAYLEDQSADPAQKIADDDESDYQRQALKLAMKSLNERGLDILKRRWLSEKKATLQELADKYQVSVERIRQIEQQAVKQLRQSIANDK